MAHLKPERRSTYKHSTFTTTTTVTAFWILSWGELRSARGREAKYIYVKTKRLGGLHRDSNDRQEHPIRRDIIENNPIDRLFTF